ncbi:SidA/IucD/PvdA family monooxygenase [Streptomyces sp. RB110-1]|uniref:SidA/IucD/PvdA family monooxygenase n=1 Tax=Streptomyces sp. RB110-1 TaxID=2794864 RepID=UPI0027DA3CD6|nr:SidA/IucD/PvdA family monooxygenase [Streptomyces sp. RB110-1]
MATPQRHRRRHHRRHPRRALPPAPHGGWPDATLTPGVHVRTAGRLTDTRVELHLEHTQQGIRTRLATDAVILATGYRERPLDAVLGGLTPYLSRDASTAPASTTSTDSSSTPPSPDTSTYRTPNATPTESAPPTSASPPGAAPPSSTTSPAPTPTPSPNAPPSPPSASPPAPHHPHPDPAHHHLTRTH